jgi:hypothetical protein
MISVRKNKKSIALTKQEHRSFRKWCDGRLVMDAAEELGLSRFTIHRIYFSGQGSPETIEKILTKIKAGVETPAE